MPSYSPFEGIQVLGRRKYRQRKAVPEFTSDRNERVKVLVYSRIRNLDSKRVSLGIKLRHAVSKFRRTVSMKITIEDRK